MYILIKFLRNKVYLVHGSARAAKTFTVSILKNLWHYTGNLNLDLYIFIFLYNSRRGKIFNQFPIKYEPLAVPRKVADAPLAFRCKTNICKARPCLKNTIRDGGSTALHTAYIVDSVDTVCTFETVLHCLNSSRYAYRYVMLYRSLFEQANELLSKKLELSGWVMDWMYTPQTVMNTRAPAVLKQRMKYEHTKKITLVALISVALFKELTLSSFCEVENGCSLLTLHPT